MKCASFAVNEEQFYLHEQKGKIGILKIREILT